MAFRDSPRLRANWCDLSDRGSTACCAANSFLATCAAVHESRRGCNSDRRDTTDLPTGGSSKADTGGSNGHQLFERRDWPDCLMRRTPPLRCRHQVRGRRRASLRLEEGDAYRSPFSSQGPSTAAENQTGAFSGELARSSDLLDSSCTHKAGSTSIRSQ